MNECKDCLAQKDLPLSKGGMNTIDNIQPLCLSCNIKKGTKIIDYRKERE